MSVRGSFTVTAAQPARSLLLVIPGLLAASDPEPDLPALATFLARADLARTPPRSLEALLFALFRAEIPAEGDLPVAAVTRVLDLGVIDDGWWLRADPVHLIPDRDRLILTDASQLDITPEEADALAAEIAEVYKADGWLLKAPHPARWYLRPPHAPELLTTPLVDVVARDIHPALPRGKDGKAWHTVLNEVQILLHTARANTMREQAGKPPINSLWFWGGGRLPAIGEHGVAQAWSTEVVAQALAWLSQTAFEAAPASFDAWLNRAQAGRHLIVLDQPRALVQHRAWPQWMELMERFERDWFAPLLAAIREGRIAEARLVTDSGCEFRLDPRATRRWWRRRRSLLSWRD
jgi:hypothetical protein